MPIFSYALTKYNDSGLNFKLRKDITLSRKPHNRIDNMHSPGEGLPYEEYTGVCHELGSYFQEKIPKRVCQFFTKIPKRAIISVRNSR